MRLKFNIRTLDKLLLLLFTVFSAVYITLGFISSESYPISMKVIGTMFAVLLIYFDMRYFGILKEGKR